MREVTRFEGPEQSPGFLLWQVGAKWRRQIESALSELDLTHVQFVLLAGLGWHQGQISQVELARFCATDIGMTSQVLRALEKKGLITRQQKPGDERSKFPVLTKAGAELVERAIPVVEAVDAAFFAKPGLTKCAEFLQKLR